MIGATAPQGIKALAFDAYGTLFDVHSVIAACEQRFPGRGQELSRLWRAKQLEYSWLVSLMDRYEDFWQVTERALTFACADLDLPCEPAIRATLMAAYDHLETYPEVPKALQRLTTRPLVIFSNGSPRMLSAVVQATGLTEVCTDVISVDEVRVYKPSPRVYALLPRKLGLAAEAIGYVSSNSFDVIGAKSFGFWTCWVNRCQTTLDALAATPDLSVTTLTDLADALGPALA